LRGPSARSREGARTDKPGKPSRGSGAQHDKKRADLSVRHDAAQPVRPQPRSERGRANRENRRAVRGSSMTKRERIFLFDTTLRGPSARSREASEDGQTGKTVARFGGAA